MPRLICAAIVALLLTLTVGGATAASAVAFDRGANEAKLLRLVNHARTKRSLKALKVATPLHRAARSHARDMVVHDYFGHSSLAGAGPVTRTRRAGYSASGCSQWSVGEVIGWGKSYRGTPESIFRAWMHSRSHKRVILTSRWRDVGIGCVRGTFRGVSGAIMYTIDFGRRVE